MFNGKLGCVLNNSMINYFHRCNLQVQFDGCSKSPHSKNLVEAFIETGPSYLYYIEKNPGVIRVNDNPYSSMCLNT
jgi:hypothetical protein